MDISKFDYTLPRELIAQKPANPRDSSKLLVLDRNSGEIRHTKFHNIINFLTPNDVLVFNKSKVFPARIFGRKKTKGKVEVLILKFLQKNEVFDIQGIIPSNEGLSLSQVSVCEVITKPGLFLHDTIFFEGFEGRVIKRDGYITHMEFNLPYHRLLSKLNMTGHTPIPPYIKKTGLSETDLRDKYQTVYAKNIGSAAAPTAGLHFTKELLKKIKNKGVQMEYVTLHVGLGTFAPVKEKDIKNHIIHEEFFDVDADTIKRLNTAKKDGKRIVAVGTTTTRVLETLATSGGSLSTNYQLLSEPEALGSRRPSTNLFIYPPYKFKFVDSMITNFHLPKSTLLALVSAFVTSPNSKAKFMDFKTTIIGKAYQEAIDKKYRFFSFGDGMLVI